MMSLRTLVQHCKSPTTLLAAPAAMLLSQGEAKALLVFEILQTGSDVTINANGSISQVSTYVFQAGSPGGVITALDADIAAGVRPTCIWNFYAVTGPSNFGTGGLFNADTSSGDCVRAHKTSLGLPVAYVVGTPLSASMIFTNKTLADLGLSSTSGLLGEWELTGTSVNGATEKFQVWAGSAPTSKVPGPVPLMGAAAALGLSRRLRKRIAAPLSTPPQA